jgi:hypothetical protein
MNDSRTQDRPDAQDGEAPPGRVSFWTIVLSTLAAAIGVQSRANKERDFSHGRAGPFIVAGVIFTVLFVLVLVVVVRLVLQAAA